MAIEKAFRALEKENDKLKKKLAKSLTRIKNMNDAIEHCQTCSKNDCDACDGILSEEWTLKGD